MEQSGANFAMRKGKMESNKSVEVNCVFQYKQFKRKLFLSRKSFFHSYLGTSRWRKFVLEQIKYKTGNIMLINSFAVRITKPLGYALFCLFQKRKRCTRSRKN